MVKQIDLENFVQLHSNRKDTEVNFQQPNIQLENSGGSLEVILPTDQHTVGTGTGSQEEKLPETNTQLAGRLANLF